jgi:hypothetical protein
MKKIAVVFFAVLISITGFAQNSKYVNAVNYFADYNSANEQSALDKAKENIDSAAVNEKTKDKPKTHVLRGQVYLAIFQRNLRAETERQTAISDPKKGEAMGYFNTSASELMTAYDAFALAKTQDTKLNFTTEINKGINDISILLTNKAVYDYSNKNYASALPSFEKAYVINGPKDTITLNNIALCAERAKNYDKAKQYYLKMIDAKLGRGATYSSLVNIYFTIADTAGGLELLRKGIEAYPSNIDLLITQTNYYLVKGKSEDALKNLNVVIKANQTNPSLFLARGNTYDKLANPVNEAGKFIEQPKDFEDKIKLAEDDYKSAIALKPNFFDALYCLGVLYNNYGVSINKIADKIKDPAKYKAEDARSKEQFSKAMVVFEKALEVNSKDKNSMLALKQIYARLELNDKMNAMSELLKKQ